MAQVHPTAIVGPDVELGENATIGPWCVVDGRVWLGEGVSLLAHVHVRGPAVIGPRTVLYPGVCIGFPGQDFKFKIGDPTAGVVIGADSILREHVTVHAATKSEMPTTVGDHVMMMVNAHVGHDARVGDRVIMVNNSCIAGHAQVADQVTLSAGSMVHQFVRVGRMVFFQGKGGASLDVPPFCVAVRDNTLAGVNLVGMRRSGMPREHITIVRSVFNQVFKRVCPTEEILAVLDARAPECPPLEEMATFIRASTRGIAPGFGRPPRGWITWLDDAARARLAHAQDDKDDDVL
ncbi:MAG: acyl-ACP--UDP-N-acetylglucosamine O-acyltransferase [Phycisphaeraceae bacterium]|nr:acyl-ACP--UDP-N-acetylglucosamine O-acyltransferase [Phycisphaeraceae bacterium]MCW5755385.1 acyl-ACP--UDP-N-acetylglucosamine O-acyltransferase [Phycisphaeraceae bacterium]